MRSTSDTPVTNVTFVAFDFETTGLRPGQDRVIEFGAVRFSLGDELAAFGQLVNPGVPVGADAAAISGITTEMLVGKPGVADVLPDFVAFIGDSVLMAHNAAFDSGFLRAELERAGLPQVNNTIIDTQVLAQRAFPGKKSYALQNLVEILGIPPNTAHRATDDARQCMRLFTRCAEAMSFMGDLQLAEVLT